MENRHITEKVIQGLKEMVYGVEISNDITSAHYEIERLQNKILDIQYNELLKLLNKEQMEEVIKSRSIYEQTEIVIERIKKMFNVQITDNKVLRKITEIQNEIDMRQRNMSSMLEDLKDLASYYDKKAD